MARFLAAGGDRGDDVELEVLTGDRGAVQHVVALLRQPAQPLADHFLHALGDPDLVDAEVGSPLAVGVLVDRAPLGEADQHLDREEGIAARFYVYRGRAARVLAR